MNAIDISLSFQKSLKPKLIEEKIDYYFYRRVAHLMVPIFYRLKFTPNQVTSLSLLSGLFACYSVYHFHFVAATLYGIFAICLDCSDGQLARLTGQSSPIGRAMDGLFDLIWIALFWLSIQWSHYFPIHGFDHLIWFMIAGGASMILHCWRFDGVRIQYFKLTNPKQAEKDLDLPTAMALMKSEFQKWHFFSAALGFCIVFHLTFFVNKKKKNTSLQLSQGRQDQIKTILDPEIVRWPWLGESIHNTLVLLGTFIAVWTPYGLILAIGLIAIPMNLYWIYCELKWHTAVRQAQRIIS